MTLSARECAIIDFEREWWQSNDRSTKQERIRVDLEISPARYYALLEELIATADAYDYDPLVMTRLRKRRIARRRATVEGEAPQWSRPR